MKPPPRVVPQGSWPSGAENVPIAHLAQTTVELREAAEIPFYDVGGDRIAVVELSAGVVWLVEFAGGREGTTVMGPEHDMDDAALIRDLLRYLRLEDDAIEWTRTDGV